MFLQIVWRNLICRNIPMPKQDFLSAAPAKYLGPGPTSAGRSYPNRCYWKKHPIIHAPPLIFPVIYNIDIMTSRIAREGKTIGVMISFYCRTHHQSNTPCLECAQLLEYALKALKRCPFQEDKTTCVKCPVHCYKRDMREKIRTVMRYSGPRMIYRHPMLAVFHIIDSRRKAPIKAIKSNT